MTKPDNRTLDEVCADDEAMFLSRLEKQCTRFDLHDWKEACRFQRECIDIAFKRLGIPNWHLLKQKRLNEIYETKRIRVENRTYARFDKWKSGVYLYVKDEGGTHGDLAYFVSDKFKINENPTLFAGQRIWLPGATHRDNTSQYFVFTNVPVDDFNKHFVLPVVGGLS